MKRSVIISMFTMLLLAGCMAERYPVSPDAQNPNQPYTVDAVVTVKQDTDGTVFFQLTDSQRLYPGPDYPFTRQMRAWGSLTIHTDEVPPYGKRVDVNWLEPLDEGKLVQILPALETKMGFDLMNSWITTAEDGYLTLHYMTWWGDPAGHHDFFLVSQDPDNPYSVTLYQDAHSDGQTTYSEGIICFDINSLPDTGEDSKTLTLNWITTQGKAQTAKFGFKTRK